MAWWTHLLFFEKELGDQKGPKLEPGERRFSLGFIRRALREYVRQNYIDLLYLVLSLFTYVYLGLSVVTFFFETHVPRIFPNIIEVLSEPYLGVLGIYVVVKEIERRRGHLKRRTWGELFATIWFIFFLTATAFTFFSESYQTSHIYKTVVTNALAAVIIRLGTIIR